MSTINLSKNVDELVAAWKDVLDQKTQTNWALFGYEGQTNNLKFVSKGTGGIEELTEDLNSGNIMYAFVKVDDPKTSLEKYVLINWQGEGANTVRKGLCANHLRDVERLFKGAHLTISARNEEEVEPQLIIDQVAKAGSAYSFKAPRVDNIEPTGPIGTTYQRVNPIKEINSKERDSFWRKEEAEEKRRVEEEQEKRVFERQRSEIEVRQREEKETTKREAEASIRNNNIDHIKHVAQIAEQQSSIPAPSSFEDAVQPSKVNQSEVLRNQRKQEAHDLIAQRTIDARLIFEQNTSAGQVKRIPEKPVRASILKAQAQAQMAEKTGTTVENQPPSAVAEEQASDEEVDQFSTIKRSPKDADRKPDHTPGTTPQEIINNEINNKHEPVHQITDQQFVDEYLYGLTSPGLQAKALYDYQAADDTEITFDPGDLITNIDQVDEGWWQGLAPNGAYGLFPANYVEIIP